jgi:hypothetical protein
MDMAANPDEVGVRPEELERRREVKSRRAQIEATAQQAGQEKPLDPQEEAERLEAARAYFGEDESHFVRFLDDCVKMSVDAMLEIRQQQSECWDIYNEKEPPAYAFKENWQTRVVVPKPFSSVQFFLAIVRKAFDPQFLSIENEQDQEVAEFWQKLMTLQLSRSFSNFPINFTDATGMAAAVGQSMEMIPIWRPGHGIEWVLIEPWKIHRDPDSLSRRPQSGMYWIHQEWLDYYDLAAKQDRGIYRNVPEMGPGGQWGNPKGDVNLTKEELQRRRDMLWQRSGFRTMCLVSEYWGTVLDKGGRMLLPKGTFTVAADRVIKGPTVPRHPTLRWPGTGFSPLPHLLRFDGRSLIQGIKSLWYFMCNLWALHADYLNWIVNPPTEIDITALVDQDDLDDYPGKQYLTRGSVSGQQVVRTVDRRSNTGDVLAEMNFADQRFQEGVMINYAAQGLPGYRQQVTARESAQNLEQSLTIVGLMGENLEDGALNAIVAAAEVLAMNITYPELAMMMGEEVARKYRTRVTPRTPTGVRLPPLTTGAFKVSGVSTLMRNQEIIDAIANLILPLFDGERGKVFPAYMKPFQLLRSIERRLNLKDEGILVDAQKAKEIDDAQQAQQDAAIQEMRRKQAAESVKTEHEALRHGALADKSHAEAEANRAQAQLFGAQAEAVGEGEAPGGGEGAPPAPPEGA